MLPIVRMADVGSQLVQSAISLPTYPSVLKELVDNAIDAQATHIDCWINPCSWSMRVVDDGFGIDKEDLKGQLGCARGMSSKYASEAPTDSEMFLGFRGQALASMGTIASLEIISRRQGFATTYHKVVKNGKTLSCGSTERHARPSSGTMVIVKDMYHSVPVRRLSGKDQISSSIQACTKVIETTALTFSSLPNCRPDRSSLSITLTLEGNAAVGIPSRRLINVTAEPNLLSTFASLFGEDLTASSKSFRASAQGVHVRGFLSLKGYPTKAYQYLFVNGHSLAKSELCKVIEDAYTAANVFAQEAGDDEVDADRGEMALQKSGKKGFTRTRTCHPVFVLHLQLPKSEVDHSLTPLKNSVMFKDAPLVRSVLASVMRGLLRSAGFNPPKIVQTKRWRPPAPVSQTAKPLAFPQEQPPISAPLQPAQNSSIFDNPLPPSYACSLPKRQSFTTNVASDRFTNGGDPRKVTRQPPEWLVKVLRERAQQVFPAFTSVAQPNSVRLAQAVDLKQDNDRADLPADDFGLERLQLTKMHLQHAKVVAQIDDKFICCTVASPAKQPGGMVLVLIDQHAADERIRVERFLQQIMREFRSGGVAATLLEVPHSVQLLQKQLIFLSDHPESRLLLQRWGFQVSQFDSKLNKVSVNSVPTMLLARLGAIGGEEVSKIVTEYIAFLQTQTTLSLVSSDSAVWNELSLSRGSAGLLRWMPRRMKELVDSKACRGAIMFNDPLTLEKCTQLIEQLSQTSFPFICAHGRPSIFPLVRLPPRSDPFVPQAVDWANISLEKVDKKHSSTARLE